MIRALVLIMEPLFPNNEEIDSSFDFHTSAHSEKRESTGRQRVEISNQLPRALVPARRSLDDGKARESPQSLSFSEFRNEGLSASSDRF